MILVPLSYFNEKLLLERYMLATRCDGGEAAADLVKSGEKVVVIQRASTADGLHFFEFEKDARSSGGVVGGLKSLDFTSDSLEADLEQIRVGVIPEKYDRGRIDYEMEENNSVSSSVYEGSMRVSLEENL